MGSSHHGDKPKSDLMQAMLKARKDHAAEFAARMTPEVTLGKLNEYVEGMYGPTDEGAIGFRVGHDERNRRVILDFNSPVAWLAMEPDQARHLAQLLVNHADACRLVTVGSGDERS